MTRPPSATHASSMPADASENTPVAAAATANLNATRPEASLMRLSPVRIALTRPGSGRRAVIDAVATASVGETMAPSANAAASGSAGISVCMANPTTTTVANTSPNASSSTGRITSRKSRLGISQPSE